MSWHSIFKDTCTKCGRRFYENGFALCSRCRKLLRKKVRKMRKSEVPPAVWFIRKNVSLYRVQKAERYLNNFRDRILETVYRSYHGSYKVQYAKSNVVALLHLICYVLFGQPLLISGTVIGCAGDTALEDVLKRYFNQDSPFISFKKRYDKVKTGKRLGGWIDIGPYVFPLLGGELFFEGTLRSLFQVAKRALKDKNYAYEIMEYDEAIVEYLIRAVKSEYKG